MRVTHLMIACMEAMSTHRDVQMTTVLIAEAINAMQELGTAHHKLPARYLPVSSTMLPGPLSKLRNLRWIKRFKVEVATRHVGGTEYPVIERRYNIQPTFLSVWDRIISEGLIDDRLNIAPFALTEAYQDAAEANADAVMESMREPSPEEPYVPHKEPLFGRSLIHDRNNAGMPYMLRLWIGRLRFHLFYRGDLDEDCHDHPWNFWTYPFTPYVEEVLLQVEPDYFETYLRVVPAFRWNYRAAETKHRVLGRYGGVVTREVGSENGYSLNSLFVDADTANDLILSRGYRPRVETGKIYTVVWRGSYKRMWGFWKRGLERYCFVPFRKYIWEGGKDAPCE